MKRPPISTFLWNCGEWTMVALATFWNSSLHIKMRICDGRILTQVAIRQKTENHFCIENDLSYQMKREETSVMRLTWWSLKGCQRLIRLATECKLFGHNSAMMFLISRSCPQPDGPLIRASDHRSDHGKRSLHQDNTTLPW